MDRIVYGDHPSQFAELSTPPDATGVPVVVVVHGGFWMQRYDLGLGRPLAADLVAHGVAAYNVEYRRLGGGTNQVRLMVGADGKVTGCAIHSPSLPESLNARICVFATERASFEPARDSDGQAMASVWTASPLELGPLPAYAHAGSLVGSSALGPTWGLTAPPSSAVPPPGLYPGLVTGF